MEDGRTGNTGLSELKCFIIPRMLLKSIFQNYYKGNCKLCGKSIGKTISVAPHGMSRKSFQVRHCVGSIYFRYFVPYNVSTLVHDDVFLMLPDLTVCLDSVVFTKDGFLDKHKINIFVMFSFFFLVTV